MIYSRWYPSKLLDFLYACICISIHMYICICIYIYIYTHIHIHVGLPQGVIIQKHGCCLPRILPASALPDRPASAASAQGSTSMGSNISLPPAAQQHVKRKPQAVFLHDGGETMGMGVFYVSFVTSVRIWWNIGMYDLFLDFEDCIIQQLADWQ